MEVCMALAEAFIAFIQAFYGECSSEGERRIVAPEVEISKFFTYPICGCRLAADGASLQN